MRMLVGLVLTVAFAYTAITAGLDAGLVLLALWAGSLGVLALGLRWVSRGEPR